jgi:predicted ArsR family transcriptional regulator
MHAILDYSVAVATDETRGWTFLSNHGHVLIALSRDSDARIRDIAATVGITERAAQGILKDLEDGGYVAKERVGRRNTYRVDGRRTLRHPAESDTSVDDLVAIFDKAE